MVRSPETVSTFLHMAYVPCPRVYDEDLPEPAMARWLVKPRDGCGGRGIYFWTGDPFLFQKEPNSYLQEYVRGVSCSAVFLGSGRGARLLGVTRQLVGTRWLHAAPFAY